jgi:hypothetical protein
MTPALIMALLPVVTPLITSLVKKLEGLFPPKSGTIKADTVVGSIKVILDSLAASGVLKTDGAPSGNPQLDIMLRTVLETVVQALKGQGQLGGTPVVATGGSATATTTAQTSGLTLFPGEYTLRMTVK